MSKSLYTVLAVVLVLVIAAASFYGGMVFGKGQAEAGAAASRAAFGAAAAAGLPGAPNASGTLGARGQRGNMLFGTIKTIGDGSLVLTDSNGKETTVKVTDP